MTVPAQTSPCNCWSPRGVDQVKGLSHVQTSSWNDDDRLAPGRLKQARLVPIVVPHRAAGRQCQAPAPSPSHEALVANFAGLWARRSGRPASRLVPLLDAPNPSWERSTLDPAARGVSHQLLRCPIAASDVADRQYTMGLLVVIEAHLSGAGLVLGPINVFVVLVIGVGHRDRRRRVSVDVGRGRKEIHRIGQGWDPVRYMSTGSSRLGGTTPPASCPSPPSTKLTVGPAPTRGSQPCRACSQARSASALNATSNTLWTVVDARSSARTDTAAASAGG